ncbi:MAG: glutamine--fructose-6-phosphate transaminase (isomerizing) [Candidatus Pacebacteria bacterium]|nr:glutamine--fructose-6-phosphate transaminase (isomerizing) [Candidatus Paceibacterota bacterium]
MCGIIGYSAKHKQTNISNKIVGGLKTMEYRGYDSWGIAISTDKNIFVEKRIGSIPDFLASKKDSCLGIGHTRWATHGGVTKNNAHPHLAKNGRFAVVQNGIVENYLALKKQLEKLGYVFKTQTDTEVIVHLLDYQLKTTKDIREAVRKVFLKLAGRNTFVVLDNLTQKIIAIRQGSPLIAGVNDHETCLASDTMPLLGQVDKVAYISDGQLVELNNGSIQIFSVHDGKAVEVEYHKLTQEVQKQDRDGFPHFMIKEIFEQQHTVVEATNYSEQAFKPLINQLKKTRKIYTLGAGTAAFAAGQIARYLRAVGLDAYELRSYETGNYLSIISQKDLVIAVSQSGETADTLTVIEELKKKQVKVVSIVNMVGSTLTRLSDFSFFSRSGPEICVASTKAYTAQVAWGYLLAQTIAGNYDQAQKNIRDSAKKLQSYFADKTQQTVLKKLAKKLAEQEHVFILGKNQHFYSALEAALKIKEITYKHFEGFSAGELKHGVIALIESGTFVMGIVGNDPQEKNDVISALAEVRARGARVIGIAQEANEFFDDYLFAPNLGDLDPISKVIPFQLLSYYLALELGNDPDKPRNLAKSVTVK